MKKIVVLLCMIVLFGCVDKGVYTDEEYKLLEEYGIVDEATKSCEFQETVQVMLKGDFKKEYVSTYCSMDLDSSLGVNQFIEAGLREEEIKEYQSYSYMKEENIERYLAFEADTIKDKILRVNMNLDIEPYGITTIIEDLDDYTMLVNKYNALPEGYEPDDLVEVGPACIYGKDYSCSTTKKVLRKAAADEWNKFVEAAKNEGIELRVIAALRTYNYQKDLYNYYANLRGEEYAEKYYARPGQSEHNCGLAIDITFNDHVYHEIEGKEGYDWIVQNMHEYGFILRYPKDKVDITLYGYESWHLRYVGKEVAKIIYDGQLTLEEYHAMK